jgi:hypothetical protein
VAKKKANSPKSITRVTHRVPNLKERTGAVGTSDQFRLRLPQGMRDKLAEAAKTNGHSLNSEIIHRLTRSLEREEVQKKLSNHLKIQGDRLAKVEGEIAALVEQLRR